MRREIDELKREAQRISAEIQELNPAADGGAHQGSAHRPLSDDLKRRLLSLRSDMFEAGIYVPLLVRFDSATVSQADSRAIAEQLATWGGGS